MISGMILAFVVQAGAAQSGPPRAGRADHRDVYHGVTVTDPFRWLEQAGDPEVQRWVRSQDSWTRRWAARDPERVAIAREIREVTEAHVTNPVAIRGGRYFYSRFSGTGPQRSISIVMRERPDAAPMVLLDADSVEAQMGRAPARFAPGPRGRRLAFGTTEAGGVWETWHVLDVDEDTLYPDRLDGVHGSLSSITWTSDGIGFYYQRYERRGGVEAQVGDGVLMFHRVGSEQADDREVYRPPLGQSLFLSHTASAAGRYLVLFERRGSESAARVLLRGRDDPTGPTRPLVDSALAAFAYAGEYDGHLYFQTNLDAPNGRVIAIDPDRPDRAHWREIIPERVDGISTWVSGSAPAGVQLLGARLVVTYMVNGIWTPRVFTVTGEPIYDVELPYIGSIWSGFVGSERGDRALYQLQGLADPGSMFELNVRTGASRLVERARLDFDPSAFVTEHVNVPARDGESIPTFVVRRRDTPLDGTAPLVLYGYGFAGWNAAPYFYPPMAAWVSRGGIWVVTTPRGDGGYGSAWHLAGRRRNKQTTIDDYVDVARWLGTNGYTSPDRLVANGSSAGGAMVAAALVRHPAVFAAGILDYPMIDVLRYDQFAYAKRWVVEYGSAEDAGDFEVLRSYSPYHNVRAGVCYPAMLLAPGENDGLTPPLHAYKFVAALQEAQSCDRPILLRVSWGAGHSAGADIPTSVENWADQLAFLRRVLPD